MSELVLNDDFSVDLSKWQNYNPSYWSVSGGYLYASSAGKSTVTIEYKFSQGIAYTNYRCEWKLTNIANSGSLAFGGYTSTKIDFDAYGVGEFSVEFNSGSANGEILLVSSGPTGPNYVLDYINLYQLGDKKPALINPCPLNTFVNKGI